MIARFLLAMTLTSAAHDVGGAPHDHTKPPRIEKPRIDDTMRASIYADNWFVLYINGRLVTSDPIAFIPHNVVSIDILPEYPMTIAVMARDNADPKSGMEYNDSKIGDGGFILKFADGTVTNASWKAKDFLHGPLNSDTSNPKVRTTPIPDNWFAIDFDDSSWSPAKEYSEQQIDPKKPYFEHDFEGARWIWSDDLKLDNTVIFRTRIESAPDGRKANPNWPKGHILPSATAAPFLTAHQATASPGATNARSASQRLDASAPPQALAFSPFAGSLDIKWDEDFVIVGSNALPDHQMMKGITAWNQQVPLPQNFFGENAWRIPLDPRPSPDPVSAKTSLFKGAIAVAINGVPIFNPIKQDGRTDTKLAGELDEFGGHAGRADDYHYHLPPTFLNKLVGDNQPIGFAMDGYPLFGFNEIDGSSAKDLDDFNGHEHDGLGYHYHSSNDYPYLNGGLKGVAEIRDGQVVNQPRTQGVRPYTRPLRGAKITDFRNPEENKYSLIYDLDGKSHRVDYTTHSGGSVDFTFVDPDGTMRNESHAPRQRDKGRARGSSVEDRDKPGKRGSKGGNRPNEPRQPRGKPGQAANTARTPWILVHASELDTNKDGDLALTELLDEARSVFSGYDADDDGFLTKSEMENGKPGIRSALNGFVKQHKLEMDQDHDSKVSAAEMAGQFKKFFDQHDANRDHILSADEVTVIGGIKPRFPGKGPATQNEALEPRSPRNSKQPNVILILIDDMGWNDVGFAGNQTTDTPHIDQLARDGFTFTNAYSSAPNCAPTRACLISGQYPPRHGIYTVVDERHAPGSPHHKMLAAPSKGDLATETITIAEQFKANGYATAMFGMWNLGRGNNKPVTPEGQGFDLFEKPRSIGFEKDRYINDKGEYLTDRFTDEAISFLERERDGPFFIYLAYHAVHSPFEPKPELLAKYRDKKVDNPEYAATVDAVDQNLGRLQAALRRAGIDDNTYIVFTSDNGGNRRETAPLRSGKGSIYEGGIRVPAAVSGPGIAKGGSSAAPILSMDFYPTLLDLAGLEPKPSAKLDGISFASTLRGGRDPQRPAVFWHFPSYIGGGGPSSAVRMGDYKLIQLFEGNRLELYNLTNDPGESVDLAIREPDKTKQLLGTLQSWQRETNAPLVTEPNPAFDPSAQPKRGRENRGKGKKSNT